MHSARASFEEICDREAGMIYHTHVFGFAALHRLEVPTALPPRPPRPALLSQTIMIAAAVPNREGLLDAAEGDP